MGYGYDYTWGVIARDLGVAIGIIDGVPVDHNLRKRGALYDSHEQLALMPSYLCKRPHFTEDEAFRTLRTYR